MQYFTYYCSKTITKLKKEKKKNRFCHGRKKKDEHLLKSLFRKMEYMYNDEDNKTKIYERKLSLN